MTKQRNTFAKRQRENEKRHKANQKRLKRADKKAARGLDLQPEPNLPEEPISQD